MKTLTNSTFDGYARPQQPIASSGVALAPGLSGVQSRFPGVVVRGLSGGGTRRRSAAAKWGRYLTYLILLTWVASFGIGFFRALAVLTVIGFVATICGLRRPILGLMGVSMLSTLDALSSSLLLKGGFLRFNTFNYWLLLVMVCSIPFLLRLKNPQTRLLQIFILLLSAQLIISPDLKGGLAAMLHIVTTYGLIIYIARAVARERSERDWYWVALVNGVLSASGGLAFYMQKGSLPYVNPNTFVYFPLAGIIAICLAFRFASRRGQLILGLLAAVNLVWIFLSGSRGGLLISALCMLYLIVEMRGLSRRFVFVGVAAVLGFAVWVQFGQKQDSKRDTMTRLESLLDPTRSARDRTSGRSDLAIGAWHIFLKNPFGAGTGAFEAQWAKLGIQEGMSGEKWMGQKRASNSAWLAILAENGIPGVVLLSAFVLSFAVVGWYKRRQGLFPLGLLMTGVLAIAFAVHEFKGKAIWFPVAAAMVLLHRESTVLSLQRSRKSTRRRLAQHRYAYNHAPAVIRQKM